jgi:aminoglycoside phosphotransferase (APT) family kinase protein
MSLQLPRTLEAALDPSWLSEALSPGDEAGRRVLRAEVVEAVQVDQTIKATIVRLKAHFADGESENLCLKGFLDRKDGRVGGGEAAVREAGFYSQLAPGIGVRTPTAVATPTDRETRHSVIIMGDLIVEGARFCTALEPFDADLAAQSLEQLARLHCCRTTIGPIEAIDWTSRQIDWLSRYMTLGTLQGLMDGPRSEGLTARTRDADLLIRGLQALAAEDARRPATLIHGDCHAGNIFQTADGVGLIDWQLLQQGGWALDVAYHIAAVLPVEVAEREERALLNHYLEAARGLGGIMPDAEEAWTEYRMSAVYGLFLWGITRTVDPAVIKTFVGRLGAAVDRHDSYRLLGL